MTGEGFSTITMTVERLRRNIPHLKNLQKASVPKRKQIITAATSELINTLCDCCLNAVKGNLKISKLQKKKLSRHTSTIRALSKKRQSVSNRRQLLLQKGGFLPILIRPVLTFAALLTRLLNK